MANANESGYAPLQFPWKLHALLERCSDDNETSVSWLPGGESFQVHDKAAFARNVMPAYFKSAVYKSFQRNLNLWGWKTVLKQEGRAIYHHDFFVRGRPDLCHKMARGSGAPPKVVETFQTAADSSLGTESSEPQGARALHGVSLPTAPAFLQSAIENIQMTQPQAAPPSGTSITAHLMVDALKNASNSMLLSLLNPQMFQEAASSILAAETLMQSQLLFARSMAGRIKSDEVQEAASVLGLANMLSGQPEGSHNFNNMLSVHNKQAETPVASLSSQMDQDSQGSWNQGPFRKRKLTQSLEPAADSSISDACGQVFPKTKKNCPMKDVSIPTDAVSASAGEPTIEMVPCRARAMPLNHNPHTAYFEIDRNKTPHSTDLICSHEACRKSGTKFRYCSICMVPASKRTFSYFHSHRDKKKDSTSEDVAQFCSPVAQASSMLVDQTGVTTGSGSTPETVPTPAPLSAAAAQKSDQPSRDVANRASTFASIPHNEDEVDSSTPTKKTAKSQRLAWDKLLNQRPGRNAPDAALQCWVEKVLQVSDGGDNAAAAVKALL